MPAVLTAAEDEVDEAVGDRHDRDRSDDERGDQDAVEKNAPCDVAGPRPAEEHVAARVGKRAEEPPRLGGERMLASVAGAVQPPDVAFAAARR